MKKQNGITIIALVITIIVLLILAGVSIVFVLGDNGIVGQAQDGVEKNQEASEKEIFDLITTDYVIAKKSNQLSKTTPIKTFLEKYITNGEITSVEQITEEGENKGKYKVVVEQYSFVFPYVETLESVDSLVGKVVVNVHYTSEEIKTNTNNQVTKMNPDEEFDVDTYYSKSVFNDNGNKAYPLVVTCMNDDKNADTVKFYKKIKDESDYTYIPANARYVFGNKEEIGNEMYIGGRSAEVIAIEVDSLDEVYIIKLEYTFTDGSIGIYTYETTGGLCFAAGTKVLTENGLANIENVKAGMKVYSKNFETDENELKEVVSTSKKTACVDIYKIKIGKEYIESTDSHPYYVKNKGFIKAKDLNVGDVLVNVDGKEVIIENIEIIKNSTEINVYNMNVEDNHNYYVGEYCILVHNAGCPT